LKSANSTATHSVLIVDDDRNLTIFLTTVLSIDGHRVQTASDGESALAFLEDHDIDVIVLDLRMPRMDGRTFFRALRARGDQTPVLIASAYGAMDAQRELGAEGAIEKPFTPESLARAITEILTPS
jgi:two-component system NtrC family response regulator